MSVENTAAVLFDKNDLRVVSSGTVSEPAPSEVRIKMQRVGICK